MLRAYSARSEKQNLWQMAVLGNRYLNISALLGIALLLVVLYVPGLNLIFKCVPLSGVQFLYAAALAVVPMIAAELGKLIFRVDN